MFPEFLLNQMPTTAEPEGLHPPRSRKASGTHYYGSHMRNTGVLHKAALGNTNKTNKAALGNVVTNTHTVQLTYTYKTLYSHVLMLQLRGTFNATCVP